MGSVLSVIKKMFGGITRATNWLTADDKELRQARSRHMGDLDEPETATEDEPKDEQARTEDNYDVWEEIDHVRTNFFFGRYLTRKIRMPHTDKLKKELDELERKRQGEGEGEKQG